MSTTLVLVGIIFGTTLAVALWLAWRQHPMYLVRVQMGVGGMCCMDMEDVYIVPASCTFEGELRAASYALADLKERFGGDLPSGVWLRTLDVCKI